MASSKFLIVLLITIRLTSVITTEEESSEKFNDHQGIRDDVAASRMIGYLSTVPGRRLGRIPGHASKEDIDALRNLLATRPEAAQEQFGPPPVTEPNCYVEVQVTHRMPGKCTKLGGAIPACQARDLIAFDSACETF